MSGLAPIRMASAQVTLGLLRAREHAASPVQAAAAAPAFSGRAQTREALSARVTAFTPRAVDAPDAMLTIALVSEHLAKYGFALGAARRMMSVLLWVLESQHPGSLNGPTAGTFNLPRWALAAACGVCPRTISRALSNSAPHAAELRRWIAVADVKTDLPGLERNGAPVAVSGGLAFTVRSFPLDAGRAVHMTTREIKDLRRDLEGAKAAGLTRSTAALPTPARAPSGAMSQSITLLGKELHLLLKSLTAPSATLIPSVSDGDIDAQLGRAAVLDLLRALPAETHSAAVRRAWVQAAADALCRALSDQPGRRVWLRASWDTLRAVRYGDARAAGALVDAIDRALACAAEGHIKSPGRLANAFLTHNGFRTLVEDTRSCRIGPSPKQREEASA